MVGKKRAAPHKPQANRHSSGTFNKTNRSNSSTKNPKNNKQKEKYSNQNNYDESEAGTAKGLKKRRYDVDAFAQEPQGLDKYKFVDEEDDDEEIDSDGAFAESDEERFEDFKFSGSSKDKKVETPSDIDSDAEIDQDASDFQQDDSDDSISDGEQSSDTTKPHKKVTFKDLLDDSEEFKGKTDSDQEDINHNINTYEERKIHENLLVSLEFNLGVVSNGNNTNIGISDLLDTIKTNSSLSSIKSKLEQAQKQNKKMDGKMGVLSAPLPKRIQEKFEREAAYEITKESVSEWQGVVNTNRNAPHLQFPLNEPKRDHKKGAYISSNFKADEGLEQEIQNILKDSKIDETNLRTYEELEMKKESREQVLAKRAELRAIRELMFRQEQKAKRVAKIKSKSYHRILKKEKQKQLSKSLESNQISEDNFENLEKMEQKRAEERMSLRHKSTGKWAKSMQKYGKHNDDVRDSLQQQLEQHDELKKKISEQDYGLDIDNDSNNEYGSGSDNDDSARKDAVKQIDSILEEQKNDDPTSTEFAGDSALYKMKFMQTGIQKKNEEIKQQAIMLKQSLLDEGNIEDQNDTNLGVSGRRVYGASLNQNKESIVKPSSNKLEENQNDEKNESLESNPWINGDDSLPTASRQTFDHALTEKSKKSDKAATKLRNAKLAAEINAAKNKSMESSGSTVIDPSDIKVNDLSNKKVSDSGKAKLFVKNNKLEGDVDNNSDDEDKEGSVQFFTTKELVERAFAMDAGVFEKDEFDAEKEEIINQEIEESNVKRVILPGWGSWGGSSIKKVERMNNEQDSKPKIIPNRKDAKLDNVIINQKKIKKNTKYLAGRLPHGYANIKHYTNDISVPIGPEWNTASAHGKMVKPRVMTKMGKVIHPITKPN
ncbi:hypothetical protein BB558_001981 [Smittium angustum]|uniref:Uncharacterized protein n=1 Tax=Smittium angustum TaxID=133377 RepID=A0A2U1J9W0_SMIAN|nr:hypothetical protein BB558_001981 [Smittium angustum]